MAEGSVVKLKQIIPPKIVAAGNPTKIIRDVTEKDKDFWNWGKKIYIDLAKKYLDIGMRPLDEIIQTYSNTALEKVRVTSFDGRCQTETNQNQRRSPCVADGSSVTFKMTKPYLQKIR